MDKQMEIIGSSSKGNSILYYNGEIMVDAGISYTTIKPYLVNVKVIFLTHIHNDHFNTTTIKMICERHPNIIFVVPEYLEKDFKNLSKAHTKYYVVGIDKTYNVGTLSFTTVGLFHDVPNIGYKFNKSGFKIIHVTDTNYIDHIKAENYDIYAMECNHDEALIAQKIHDAKPTDFVYEIRARENHLSFQRTIKWFKKQKKEDSVLQPLHISSSYSDELVKEILARELL